MTPINYDKYKGHTPFNSAIEVYQIPEIDGYNYHVGSDEMWLGEFLKEEDAHLFAAAPLILQRCMELEGLLQLRYELEGVLSDYENDNRIGDIGYNTVKRVAQALSRAEEGE